MRARVVCRRERVRMCMHGCARLAALVGEWQEYPADVLEEAGVAAKKLVGRLNGIWQQPNGRAAATGTPTRSPTKSPARRGRV